jgi:hypothetical protein
MMVNLIDWDICLLATLYLFAATAFAIAGTNAVAKAMGSMEGKNTRGAAIPVNLPKDCKLSWKLSP